MLHWWWNSGRRKVWYYKSRWPASPGWDEPYSHFSLQTSRTATPWRQNCKTKWACKLNALTLFKRTLTTSNRSEKKIVFSFSYPHNYYSGSLFFASLRRIHLNNGYRQAVTIIRISQYTVYLSEMTIVVHILDWCNQLTEACFPGRRHSSF